MIEFEQIFAEPLAMTVFVYGSALMLAACAVAALWLCSPQRSTMSAHARPAVNAWS
jgi:hypothetical protein